MSELRILVLEDTAEDAELSIAALEEAGYTCRWNRVETRSEFLECLKDPAYDLILSDYSLPSFDGLAAVKLFVEHKLDIPFILISGTLGEETAIDSLKAGATDFVLKNKLFRLPLVVERALQEKEERRRVRKAEERNQLQAAALESAANAIVITDPDGTITFVNTAFTALTGYEAGEVLGKELRFLKSGLHGDAFYKDLWETILSGKVWHRELVNRRKNGSLYVEEQTITPVLDDGEIINFIAVKQDISERRRSETERKVIFEIIKGVITTPGLDEFLQLVHRELTQVMYTENCFVMLHDPETDMIQFEFWVDRRDPPPPPKPRGTGFASYVLRTGVPLRLTKESKKRLQEQGDAEQIGSVSASWLGVPLRTPSGTIGVLVLQHYEDEDAYSERDLEFLVSVGDHIALAIERKRSEMENARLAEQINAERLRLRSIIASVPGVVWEAWREQDAAGQRTDFVSNYVETMLGYSVEEWLTTPNFWLTIVHPDDRDRAGRAAAEALANQDNTPVEFRWIAKDGSIMWVEVHSAFVHDDDGRTIGVRGVTIDITERRFAQQALVESEVRYRDLVENALDIIYTHDLKGNYLSVNRAGEMITGYTAQESLKMNLADTVAPEDLERARSMIAAKLAGKEVTAYELDIIAKDGHRITVEVNTRIVEENGVPVAVQGIARDITDRKQLAEQLRQSQKMEAIGLLAGGIAHDFNNLLTVISGYGSLALKKLSPDDLLHGQITEIKNAGERAAGLTAQLLAFSRKQILKPRVHNLNKVLTDIEKMLRRIIRENIELRTVLDPDLGNIKADPGQIEQVIMNLAVNARDAMPGRGTLTIETENVYLDEKFASQNLTISPGQYIRMTVTDTGKGMDHETQERIFEPFFTTKEVGKGTGLGLSTVHGIVKQSGGDILIYSEIGYGTTFKIYLPCVDENLQWPMWHDDDTDDVSGTETILVVEDEELVRNLVSTILTGNGYQVLVAAGGAAALSVVEEHVGPIDLLLTDLIMPGMSGTELRDEVLKRLPGIRVLFMSGYTDEAISHAGILDAETAFIEKPFTPDSLIRKVREVFSLET